MSWIALQAVAVPLVPQQLPFLTFQHLSRQVLEVVAAIKGEDAEKLAEIFYNNTMKVFFDYE